MSSRSITSILNVNKTFLLKKNSNICDFGNFSRKNNFPGGKSLAVGSIKEFISSIPDHDVKTRKHYGEKRYNHTGIFSKEYNFDKNNNKRLKVQVDIAKLRIDNNFAGNPITNRQNSLIYSEKKKIISKNVQSPVKKVNNSAKKVNNLAKTYNNIFGVSTGVSTRGNSIKTYYDQVKYLLIFKG